MKICSNITPGYFLSLIRSQISGLEMLHAYLNTFSYPSPSEAKNLNPHMILNTSSIIQHVLQQMTAFYLFLYACEL